MDFYKILNEEENHYGMQYKTGLNVDILPFNPTGECTGGGIYFTREDIFAFVQYGVWVRKVTIPENDEIYEDPGKPKKWKAHRIILGKRRRINDIELIQELLDEGANIHIRKEKILRWARHNRYDDIYNLISEINSDGVLLSTNDGEILSEAGDTIICSNII